LLAAERVDLARAETILDVVVVEELGVWLNNQ
jgi:hypothetical protein